MQYECAHMLSSVRMGRMGVRTPPGLALFKSFSECYEQPCSVASYTYSDQVPKPLYTHHPELNMGNRHHKYNYTNNKYQTQTSQPLTQHTIYCKHTKTKTEFQFNSNFSFQKKMEWRSHFYSISSPET